jgi:hypothetical protein
MGDVQYIVDKLNAPPFSMGLTMLSLRYSHMHNVSKASGARS